LLEALGQALPIVAKVLDPVKPDTSIIEFLQDGGEMFVLAFARKNFVANNDQTDTCRWLNLIRHGLAFVSGHVFILMPRASGSRLYPDRGQV
jgi:hypothetical protein